MNLKKPLIIILAVLFVDQASKIWVKTHMMLNQEFKVLGNWFLIHFTENNGMAFGIEIAGENGKLLLTLFRIIASVLIAIYLVQIIRKKSHPLFIWSVSLIFAGAVGNIIDSVFYGILFSNSTLFSVATFMPEGGGYASLFHGRVVDMLYFPIIKGHYPTWFPFWRGQEFIFFRPVFNVADSAITIGVFILLIFQRRFFHNTQAKAAAEDNPAQDEQHK